MNASLIEAMHALRGTILYTINEEKIVFHPDGLLLWSKNGRIVACGAYEELAVQLPTSLTLHDYRNHLILPGFVDCHVHLPQLDCRNKTGHTLLEWLQHFIYPAEAAFADPHHARSVAKRFYQELLQAGTTTAMIYSTIHEAATHIAFEEAERSGIRAIIGKVMMDQHCPESLKELTSDSLKATERLIHRWHGRAGRLFSAVTPRFALTCSRELITEAGKIAQESGVYFQTHLAETLDEVSHAHELHHMTDYVAFYEKCRCLGNHSLFAHCIYLTDEEWKRFAASQSAIAHCPSSNLFLMSGRMPYEKMKRHQIRCGLGSDVGAGPEVSLWDVIRCGNEVHPTQIFPLTEALYRATLGGAKALNMDDRIGSFHVGKEADVVVFKLAREEKDPLQLLPQFLHHAKTPNTVAVYVQGECRYSTSFKRGSSKIKWVPKPT